jgi:hypothetical protein
VTERNEFEQRKRIDKAWKLSVVLQEHGATPQAASDLPLKARLDVALIAGVNPPSQATWQLTVEYLANRLKATGHKVECFQKGTAHYYFARCACGWESDGTGSMKAAHQIGDEHLEATG